jgi:hypothetical protein
VNRHLTESEFTDALCGLASPEIHAHLSSCEVCSAEIAAVTGAVKSFNQASLTHSRKVASLHPIDTAILGALAAPARNRRFWRAPWAINWAVGLATAALVFAFTLPLTLRHSAPQQSAAVTAPASAPAIASTAAPAIVPAATSSAIPDSAGEIDHDNQMLAAIDDELSQPDVSPLESIPGFGPPTAVQEHHKKA